MNMNISTIKIHIAIAAHIGQQAAISNLNSGGICVLRFTSFTYNRNLDNRKSITMAMIT